MRIGINGLFWDQPSTGSGQYVRALVRSLARMDGIDPLVVVGDPAAEAPPGVELRLCGRATTGNLAKLWFEQVSFPRLCRQIGIDVAHVPYLAPPLCCSMPLVVTIHDLIPLLLPEYRGGLPVRAYMALVAAAARRATLVVTDSAASAQDIEHVLRIGRERIRVVYLAAGPAYRPVSAVEVAKVRQRLGLPEQYLLYLGGFDRRKRVPELLRAYSQAMRQLGEVALVVAGRTPELDSAFAPEPRRVVEGLALGDRVRFLGHVAEEDKPALYSGAVGLVFPSVYEGFGLPPLEALSCGTPVIATHSSSLPEVVGDAGILVQPDNVDALAEAMGALVGDSALRQRLVERALVQAARFSWERTAEQTVAVYREAAGRGSL